MDKLDKYVQGKCLEMCPQEEILMREREKMLHLLEMVPGTQHSKHPKASRKNMVKSFSRSAAGKQIKPEDLRPPKVLLKTVTYLLCEVITTKKLPWCLVYDFITDRLMAVRQDMVVQNTSRAESITLLQPIVRFHAFAAYKLCEHSVANFDATLNNNHLQECLKKLLQIYDTYDYFLNSDFDSKCGDYLRETRPEFEALYLVFNLGNDEALKRALTIPKKCKTIMVKKAMEMSLCFKYGNFVRLCRLIRDLPPLLAAVAALRLPEIRRKAFQVMSTAYSSQNLTFPVAVLQDILLYGSQNDLLQDCKYYGVKTGDACVYFTKQAFIATKTAVSPRHEVFVEDRSLEDNLQSVILGM